MQISTKLIDGVKYSPIHTIPNSIVEKINDINDNAMFISFNVLSLVNYL